MAGFLIRRALQGVAIVFLVATVTFVLVHLAPGDPFAAAFEGARVPESVRIQLRAEAGLDRPLPEQYVRYLARLARGRLGYSVANQEPVTAVLGRALPNTFALMGVALLGSFALGVAVGVLQAVRRGTLVDRVLGTASLLLASLPDFWLALVLMLTLAYWLPVLPVAGMNDPVTYAYASPAEKLLDRLQHLVLPGVTLILLSTASVARYQRTAMLEVLPEDYIRTARAKGVRERAVVMRHALRNALLPVVTLLGLALPTLVGGAVFVEVVFAWHGMGWLVVDAVGRRDYDVVTAGVVVGSALVVAGGILADILHAATDPRLRG